MSLCHHFMDEAQWVWRRIDEATNAGFGFGEETITETILLNLHRDFPNAVLVHPFTKSKERKNGADWEWWIGRDGNWIGMRVQAKRIKLPAERYESLFYQYDKDSAETQIGNLIESAKQESLTPIYILYTHSKKHIPMPANICICQLLGFQTQDLNGCLVSHAQDILDRDSRRLSDILPIAFPWHCLVCPCIADIDDQPPSGPADYIERLLRRSGDEPSTSEEGEIEKKERFVSRAVEELPEHMQILRNRDDPEGKYLGKIAKERGLGGFKLIDLGALE